jgi:hypothetical protein
MNYNYPGVSKTQRLFVLKGSVDDNNKPDLKAFIDHLKFQLPVQKKLLLFLKNNAKKILTARSCCGHPGEPGC